jgi:Uma2 family endonuclease
MLDEDMLDPRDIAPERVRPLKRVEFDRLVDLGLFEDERVELLYGVLVQMSPMGTRHAETLRRLNRALVLGVGDRGVVQVQAPFAASEDSEPEPDFGVLPPGDYSAAHPEKAILLVEVAESSIRKDRVLKARLYAEAGVPTYWLIDVARDVAHVFADPSEGRYRSHVELGRGAVLEHESLGLRIDLDAILPTPAP